MRQGLVLGLVLLLAGCGGPPPPDTGPPPMPPPPPPPNAAQVAMASPQQDAAGKQFNPPPPGMAAVYFYTPTPVGPGIVVTENLQRVGRLGPQTWMRIEVGAGQHMVRCMALDATNELSLSLPPDAMRFVAVSMPPGQPVCTMHETGPGPGRSGVLQGGRALQIR